MDGTSLPIFQSDKQVLLAGRVLSQIHQKSSSSQVQSSSRHRLKGKIAATADELEAAVRSLEPSYRSPTQDGASRRISQLAALSAPLVKLGDLALGHPTDGSECTASELEQVSDVICSFLHGATVDDAHTLACDLTELGCLPQRWHLGDDNLLFPDKVTVLPEPQALNLRCRWPVMHLWHLPRGLGGLQYSLRS